MSFCCKQVVGVASCVAFIALSSVPSAQAQTTINFDDLTFSDYAPLAEGYQSRAGSTANVTVDFRTLDPTTLTQTNSTVLLWNNGYSELSKVAFAANQGQVFEMSLTADTGYTVSLLDFRLGAYNGDRTNSQLTITDSALGVLYSQSQTTIPFSQSALYSVNTSSSNGGTLTVRFGNEWNVGIDNIRFSQAAGGVAAPEPSSIALSAVCCVPFVGLIRRRAVHSNKGE